MQSRAAIRYAKAMYDIAIEENFVNEVYKDMSLIKDLYGDCLLYTSPSPRDRTRSRMPSSA